MTAETIDQRYQRIKPILTGIYEAYVSGTMSAEDVRARLLADWHHIKPATLVPEQIVGPSGSTKACQSPRVICAPAPA